MGGKPSRDHSQRYSHNHDGSYASPSNLGSSSSSYSRNYVDYDRRSKLQSRYQIIGDNYHSLEQVLCWQISWKVYLHASSKLSCRQYDNWKNFECQCCVSTCLLCSSIDNCTKCSIDEEMGWDFYIIAQGSNILSFLDIS